MLINKRIDNILGYLIALAARICLRLRYRIQLIGIEKLPRNGRRILVLPNHPAEIDPVILGAFLWPRLKIRPVVTERFYHPPGINQVMRVMGAFPMPDMEAGAGAYKKMRIDRQMEAIADALESNDNVIMYPSGRLAKDGVERLGAASGTYTLLRKVKDVDIYMVRTTGLRGSSFSNALTGVSPDFTREFKAGIVIALKNLFFFTPKRNVEVEIKRVDDTFPVDGDVLDINSYLEKFYNAKGEEPLRLVSRSFWQEDLPTITTESQYKSQVSLDNVDPDLRKKVVSGLSEHLNIPVDKIEPNSHLSDDLGMDSLLKAELLLWLDDEFDAKDVRITELERVSDVILAASGGGSWHDDENVEPPPGWSEKSRPEPITADAPTLPMAFLKNCDRMGSHVAVADETSGVLNFSKLKTGVILMANEFSQLSGDYVGVMLPATVAADLATMAILLAGKTPVMLNWTTGRKNLEHAAEVTRLNTIITAGSFLDRLPQTDFGVLNEKFLFLEEFRRNKLTLGKKLKALWLSHHKSDSLAKRFRLDKLSESDTAVVLFTSGSESLPKGVPLSHKNILSNIKGGLVKLPLTSNDVIYGFLPPFHSFGFTVCSMLPLVSGLKSAHYPNPTEARRLAAGCLRWNVTLLLGTPSFLSGIIKAGETGGKLKTLKIMVSGAERAPESLYKSVEKLGGIALREGYGTTECGPMVTANALYGEPCGVGTPLPDTEVFIVHPDTYEPLPVGERGMILARGPGMFDGYLEPKPDTFHEINGAKWYVTGDLGFLNEAGALTLSGRLKRFVKIGGEMVSLPAIEEALSSKWPADEEGPRIAVEATERDEGRPELVLFTTLDITLDEVNDEIRSHGFANISRIGTIKKLGKIPLLGSGKTNYRELKASLTQG